VFPLLFYCRRIGYISKIMDAIPRAIITMGEELHTSLCSLNEASIDCILKNFEIELVG